MPDGSHQIIAEDYGIVDIEMTRLEACEKLPMHHRDPFDHLLIVQAQLSGFTIVTHDDNIACQDVPALTA